MRVELCTVPRFRAWYVCSMAIEVVVGDITRLALDAIVNAANSSLAGGGGVDGAIHAAAGPQLREACRPLAPCPTGEARITPGFRLKARHVIHAVGPVWHGGGNSGPKLLASAYRSSLAVAGKHNLSSIAFPAISTGIYGYPFEQATQTAVEATAENLLKEPGSLRRVVFVVRDSGALATYERVLEAQSRALD